MTNTIRATAFTVVAFLFCGYAEAQTTITVGGTLQSSVKPIGINLGDHNFYDIQLMKNLTMTNPGFAPTMYRSIIGCMSGSTTTCTDQVTNSGQVGGFWPYGSSVTVLAGSGAGCSTAVYTYSAPTGSAGGTFTFQSACSTALDNTSWILVSQTIGPGNSNASATTLTPSGGGIWWPSTTGSGSITVQSSDLPSAGVALQSADIAVTGTGDTATLTSYFDAPLGGRIFLNLNGTYQIQFLAKVKSGSGVTAVSLQRGSASSPYYSANSTFTSTWTQYNLSFTASETGSQSGNVALNFVPSNSAANEVLITNVQVIKTSGLDSTNTSPFRDEIVTELRTLKPGSLRFWGHQLTDTLANLVQSSQFLRMPSNYEAYTTSSGSQIYAYNPISYSIPDFLQLAQAASIPEVWIVIPSTFTTTEASELMDYLGGSCSGTPPAYTQLRCTSGAYGGTAQTTPWTSVFSKIHIEPGNEQWNVTFAGGAFENYNGGNTNGPTAYGQVSQAIFAAIKANANYNSSVMSMVLGAQFSNFGSVMVAAQNACNNNDEIDVAPYFMNWPTDSSYSTSLFQSTLAEPWVFWQPNVSGAPVCNGDAVGGTYVYTPSYQFFPCPSQSFTSPSYTEGAMAIARDVEANLPSSRHVPVSVYEESISPFQNPPSIGGAAAANALTDTPSSHLINFAPSLGAGLATAEQGLLNMAYGVPTQNVFQLLQYEFAANTGGTPHIWGSCVALGGGTLNICRPEALALAMVNAAIPYGATMLSTSLSPPTINVGSPNTAYASATTVNGVAANNVPLVQAWAFVSGSNKSLILMNTDTTSGSGGNHAVTWSGSNTPTGTVTVTTLTSTNITDNNESSIVVSPTTSTLTNPTGITLAPYSLVTLTWGGSGSPAITLSAGSTSGSPVTFASTNVGSTSASQTVTVTNSGTAALTISSVAPSSQFNVTSQTCTSGSIAVSGTCTVTMTFSPTATGTQTGIVALANNTGTSPVYIYLSGVGTSTSSYACTNTTADVAAIQARVNGGGTVTLSGNCDMVSGTVTIANAVTVTGTATLTGSGTAVSANPIFTVTANSVSITNLTFTRATAAYVNSSGIINGFVFTGNTVTSTNGNNGVNVNTLIQNANISNNSLSYIMQDGYQSSSSCASWNGGCDTAYGQAIRVNGGLDQTQINSNTINYTASDGIYVDYDYTLNNGGAAYYLTSNNSISYNTITHVHRIGIEVQGASSYVQCTNPGNPPGTPGTPSNCTVNLATTTGSKVNGNYIHAMYLTYYNSWTTSLVDSWQNSTYSNNTLLFDNEGGSCTNPNDGVFANFMEWAGGTRTAQGNVMAGEQVTANGVTCSPTASNGVVQGGYYGTPTFTVQNNVLAAPTWGAGTLNVAIGTEPPCSTPCSAITYVDQYNYIASASPYAGALTTSSISPLYVGSSSSGGMTTFNFSAVSALSLRLVSFTVDGVGVATQEIPDLSSTFSTDRKWLYHVTLNPSAYSSSSHTLLAIVEDVSNATQTASTTFTGGGASLTNITAGTYTVADSTASCSGSGVVCQWDGGFALPSAGQNQLSLYQAYPTNHQQWTVAAGGISGTFTICNVGIYGQTGITNACLIDSGSGSATLNGTASGNDNLWVIQTANGTTYYVKNYATGNYVQDPASPANAAMTTMGATAFQWTWMALSPSVPQTYYISSSGSDSNNGLSPTTPWQTISKVNSTTPVAGSSFLFNSGNTFAGDVTVSTPGASGSPILYGAYGSSAAPIINASGQNNCLTITTPSYITVTSVECENATQHGIYANGSASYSNFTVTYTTAINNGSNGIFVYEGSGVATNLTVANNTVYGNGASGIKIEGNYGGTFGASSGSTLTVTNNTAHDDSQKPGSGYGPDNVTSGEIYLVCPQTQSCGWGTVSNNTTYNGANGAVSSNPSTGTGSTSFPNYGVGLWLDTLTNMTVENNQSYNNYGTVGLNMEKVQNSVFAYNLAYNTITPGTYGSAAFVGVCSLQTGGGFQTVNNLVLQNTCGGNGYAIFAMNFESTSGGSNCSVSGSDCMSQNTIYGNLFRPAAAGSGNLAFVASAQVNQTGYYATAKNVLNHNGFGAPASNFIYAAGVAYSTYSAFETAWGVSTNSLQVDPLFTSPSTGVYTLTSSSPARDAATEYSTNYPPTCGGTLIDLGYLAYACGLTITPSGGQIASGGSVTLTASSSSTWSLIQSGALQGQATLSTLGPNTTTVLSLASGTYFSGQPIVITATSGSSTATATFYSTGGPYLLQMHR